MGHEHHKKNVEITPELPQVPFDLTAVSTAAGGDTSVQIMFCGGTTFSRADSDSPLYAMQPNDQEMPHRSFLIGRRAEWPSGVPGQSLDRSAAALLARKALHSDLYGVSPGDCWQLCLSGWSVRVGDGGARVALSAKRLVPMRQRVGGDVPLPPAAGTSHSYVLLSGGKLTDQPSSKYEQGTAWFAFEDQPQHPLMCSDVHLFELSRDADIPMVFAKGSQQFDAAVERGTRVKMYLYHLPAMLNGGGVVNRIHHHVQARVLVTGGVAARVPSLVARMLPPTAGSGGTFPAPCGRKPVSTESVPPDTEFCVNCWL